MSLNWAMLTPNNSPVPLPQEEMVTSVESGAELTLILPDEPPSRSATAGGSGGHKKLKETGGIWLSNQRVIFVAAARPASAKPSSFTSLSIPLSSILGSRFEQPYLGANYLVLDVLPVNGGGLTIGTRVELRFKDHPMFQFVSTLEKVRERVRYMRRSLDEEEGPPVYTAPAAESSTSMFVMAGPSAHPPAYDAL